MSASDFPDLFQILIKHAYIILYGYEHKNSLFRVVHRLQMLLIQNMLIMGESRDMSRIHIALQGLFMAPLLLTCAAYLIKYAYIYGYEHKNSLFRGCT